jgi:hypothetical protein
LAPAFVPFRRAALAWSDADIGQRGKMFNRQTPCGARSMMIDRHSHLGQLLAGVVPLGPRSFTQPQQKPADNPKR